MRLPCLLALTIRATPSAIADLHSLDHSRRILKKLQSLRPSAPDGESETT